MGNISITVDDTEIMNALKRLQRATGNIDPVMEAIGQTMVTRILTGFERSRSPYGESWKPLARSTMLQRLKRNKSNFRKGRKTRGRLSARGRREASAGFQPLVDTSALKQSVTFKVSQGVLTVGTNKEQANVMQFGKGAIPARPFMPMEGLPDAWANEAVDEIAAMLRNAIRG